MENLKNVINDVLKKANDIKTNIDETISEMEQEISHINDEIGSKTKRIIETQITGTMQEKSQFEADIKELQKDETDLKNKINTYRSMDVSSFLTEDWIRIKQAAKAAQEARLVETENARQRLEDIEQQIKALQEEKEKAHHRFKLLYFDKTEIKLIDEILEIMPVEINTRKIRILENNHLKNEIINHLILDKKLSPYMKERVVD